MSGISLTLVLQNHNASYPDMTAKVQTKLEKLTARAGIKRAFALLRQRGLSIRQFRADCGSYAEDIVQTVDDNSLLFYLRAAAS